MLQIKKNKRKKKSNSKIQINGQNITINIKSSAPSKNEFNNESKNEFDNKSNNNSNDSNDIKNKKMLSVLKYNITKLEKQHDMSESKHKYKCLSCKIMCNLKNKLSELEKYVNN